MNFSLALFKNFVHKKSVGHFLKHSCYNMVLQKNIDKLFSIGVRLSILVSEIEFLSDQYDTLLIQALNKAVEMLR